MRALRTGDVLVVWKLDRLGRTLAHLVNTVQDLSTRGVGLRVLTGQGAPIDTTTAAGRLVFGIFAALADYAEWEIMRSDTAGAQVSSALQRCCTPHYPGLCREAISASGAVNRPRRNPGGRTISIASSFSDRSTRR